MEAVNGGCYGKTGSGNAMEINWTPQAIDSLIETVRFVERFTYLIREKFTIRGRMR